MRLVPILVVLALVANGCGARSSKPFTAAGTIDCIKKKNFAGATTNRSKVGLIAAFADNGGLRATSPNGNAVTIAFTKSQETVPSTEQAFRLHAPRALRPHISDVMRTSRNAVMVWTTTPASDDEDAVEGCLAP